ncbi:hypothetical protein FZC76_14810 [Sutcliffiella horikoshii]|uniref:DUF3953 domain-containing protein n=1 Tax=Sutcliffiella horikoshii TaxID=79883 RepID=A0A5D4SWL8_9BACI|nr:hypothetical protein [Sutcliffiella horikoshii]TYS67827.1 hypothetical protein FZC76_14810 [Sutcliffiella horikoshii]
MGLFFEKVKRTKSSKGIVVIRIIVAIAMIALFFLGYRDDFNSTYLGYVILLAGLMNIMNGVESHLHREEKKVYMMDYLLGILFLFMAITQLEMI